MKNKSVFNPRLFQGNDRACSKVEKGISKCWIWDKSIQEYRSNYFVARKKGLEKKEAKKTFQDLKAAKVWLYIVVVVNNTHNSPKLAEVLSQWKENYYSKIRKGSQIYYENKTQHFGQLLNLTINQITPLCIDNWIIHLKKSLTQSTRTSFDKEVDALKTVLAFYKEHLDEPYELPIKKRHHDSAFVKEKIVKNNVITENEFLKFHDQLFKSNHGLVYAALATFQFYYALRISEINTVNII